MKNFTNWEDRASFGDIVISHLLSCRSIKMQRKILFDLVKEKRKLNSATFNSDLYRLQNRGFVDLDKQYIFFNKNKLKQYNIFSNIKTKPTGETQIMVLFDIPENKRKIRNWLRLQLKLWDFKIIQKSVWMGNGPVPKEFLERMKLFGLGECVKIYKLSKVNSK